MFGGATARATASGINTNHVAEFQLQQTLSAYNYSEFLMSSLAGALDGYSTSTSYHAFKGPDDVDMPGENQSSSANDDPEDSQDQDEEMTDLFGNDNDVEELKAERSVPPFFLLSSI